MYVARPVFCVVYTVLGTPWSPANTAEPIEFPLRGQTGVDPLNPVLDGGAHRRHLTSTTDR